MAENNGKKYICTICSREKLHSPGLLKASKRYSSPRIKQVIKIAAKEKLPLLFLSGKYGLISSDKKIPYYDLLLEKSRVNRLTRKVMNQCQKLSIGTLLFYGKPKNSQGWEPYYEVLESACQELGIRLQELLLPN